LDCSGTGRGTGESLPWSAGDILLLYTDGASETRNGEGKQVTADRIAETLAGCSGGTADEIVQTVFRMVETGVPPWMT
jgi:serine phosphatase RsbU (regulator of sigma subunit)